MRHATALQAVGLRALTVALGVLVVSSAGGWADWVVFGVIVLTVFGAAVAVNRRDHPTAKRAFTRSSDDDR